MAVGGQDLVCVRQKSSSPIPVADLRRHLEDLGDFLFSDSRSPSFLQRKTGDSKHKVLLHFILSSCFLFVGSYVYFVDEQIHCYRFQKSLIVYCSQTRCS